MRPELKDLLKQKFGILPGDESEDTVLFGVPAHYIERANANRPGGAEDG